MATIEKKITLSSSGASLQDANGNRAFIAYFGSYEKAYGALASLENCNDCTNCENCNDCNSCARCKNCVGCVDCHDSTYCKNCRSSHKLKDCTNCQVSDYSANCHNCYAAINCTNCTLCFSLRDSVNCIQCSKSCQLSGCEDCHSCTYCNDCKKCYCCKGCSKCNDCFIQNDLLAKNSMKNANLSVYSGMNIPRIENIHQKVYEAATYEGALKMHTWHSECGTAHCVAGWVIILAGAEGRELERITSTPFAAMAIYANSGHTVKCGMFYNLNEDAVIEDLKRLAQEEQA